MPITPAHTDSSRHTRPGLFQHHSHPLPARDTEFVELQDAFRRTGGLARGESLAQRMSLIGPGGYVDLARRIVAGQLFSFQWHNDFWLPMFQFDAARLTPLEGPRRVLAELRGTLDGWGVAHWYVTPHDELDGRTPLDLLNTDLHAVLAAAHSDRAAVQPSVWAA